MLISTHRRIVAIRKLCVIKAPPSDTHPQLHVVLKRGAEKMLYKKAEYETTPPS